MKVSCRIQWIYFNVFVNHFWHPSHKNAIQKAKITEPDRIIFLENQDELAPPLFLTYAIGRAFLFYSPKQNPL
jgi:hypothetical protein